MRRIFYGFLAMVVVIAILAFTVLPPLRWTLIVLLPVAAIGISDMMQTKRTLLRNFPVDRGEGGTGAAPLEFSNHVGTSLFDGLISVHNSIVGYGLRQYITVIATGKISSGFDLLKRLALGTDICHSARAGLKSADS